MTQSPVLFINERSLYAARSSHESERALNQFAQHLNEICAVRADASLCAPHPLGQLEISPRFTLGSWANASSRNRDSFRRICSMLNRAPFAAINLEDADVEYQVAGEVCIGLGLAYEKTTAAVSIHLPIDDHDSEIDVDRTFVSPAIYLEERVAVRNTCCSITLRSHEDWLRQYGVNPIDARNVWESRTTLFPGLEFLDRVENDLRILGRRSLSSVMRHLVDLSECVVRWDSVSSQFPDWPTKVTPESESRQRLCYFKDRDGVERLFDMHARYTPDAGRIHFRVDRGAGVLVVAYIGQKIL